MSAPKKKPVGRPKKKASDIVRTPHRTLGRVSDEEYAELTAAAARAGKYFSEWAVEILLREARRQRE